MPGEGGEVLSPGEEVRGGQRLHDRLHRALNDEERGQDAAGGVQGTAGVPDGRCGSEVGLNHSFCNAIWIKDEEVPFFCALQAHQN